jgi:hypothetical protein
MATVVCDWIATITSGTVTPVGGTLDQAVRGEGSVEANIGSGGMLGATFEVPTLPGGAVVYRVTGGVGSVRTSAGSSSVTKAFANGAGGSGSQSVTTAAAGAALDATSFGSVASGSELDWKITNAGALGVIASAFAVEVYYNLAPSAPTLTAPASGGNVTTLLPVFQGTHVDADGASTMESVEIEVRRVSDDALRWASGVLADTGSTFSQTYAGTALVDEVVYKWRARTKDNSGQSNNVGAWSAYQNFTTAINEAPTATQTSPAAGASVGDLTPDFSFSFSDPDLGGDSFWNPGEVATTGAQQTARAATVTYAGTALVNGTAYEWRVRVKDLGGLYSSYTGWRTFTPNVVPSPPSSLTPSGLANTLTPTISGVYNQGSGGTQVGFQYEIRQGTTTIYQSGDVLVVIATGQVYGSANAGDTPSTPPALAWGTAYEVRARSKDNVGAYSDWTSWQAFNTNAAPNSPSGITPNGAITNDTTPDLAWTHEDPDGDAQTAVDIELYDVTGATYVTGYNPKSLSQAAQTHTVTTALTNTHQYRMRIRTTGLAGPGVGAWSAPINFTVANAPTVTVLEPDPADVTTTSALVVQWSLTGGSGVQQSYRVVVYADDGTTVRHDSGVVAGVATSYTVPAGSIVNGGSYYVQVFLVDTLALAGQSSLIPFSASFAPPASVTGLTAIAVGGQEDGA